MNDPCPSPSQGDVRQKLLWLDGLAGLAAGVFFLLLAGWLSRLDGLPIRLVILIGCFNVAYGCYSTTLAVRNKRPRILIFVLIIANLSWTIVCLTLILIYWESITWFGMVHLLGEGFFVAILAFLEWRWRGFLITS